MTATGADPMGVLGSVDGRPAGWCACGPRSRYTAAIHGRSSLLAGSARADDAEVWLIVCLFVATAHRGSGLIPPLVRAAISLARERGASAIEAWPLAAGVRDAGLAHVGTETAFTRQGFRPIRRPTGRQVIMRLDLGSAPETDAESS